MNRTIVTAILGAGLLSALALGGCKNELPVEVPVSADTSTQFVRIYDDEFHPQYDKNGHTGQYIVERVGLNPRAASHADPAISLIDPKCHAAITRGDSCLRMIVTNVTNTWMDWFYYNLEADPRYGYDPDRPDCWAGTDPVSGLPQDQVTPYGQDWSQYTHFMCDMWINPEKPIHNHKGWWASIGVFTEMGGYANLWSLERGADGGWDCYYWQHDELTEAATQPHVGPMHMQWAFAVDPDPSGEEGDNRWTRLAATAYFCFISGGDQIDIEFGGELYIDNIRVARLHKPFWESFDFMAQRDEYDPSEKEIKAVGFSKNVYCYSPLHADHDQWLAEMPHRGAVDY